MSSAAAPLDAALSGVDRRRLEKAHGVLRDAVAAYSRLHAPKPPQSGSGLVWGDGDEIAAAQRAVEVAEASLWQARAELLGWRRGSQTPSAALVADWFSDEDAVYDELPDDPPV